MACLGRCRGRSSEPALPSLQDLVNIEMFLTAKEVEESLERRETATCLAWCHDNKSRLRKMKVCGLPREGAPEGAGLHRGGAPGGAGRTALAGGAGAAPAPGPKCFLTCRFSVL